MHICAAPSAAVSLVSGHTGLKQEGYGAERVVRVRRLLAFGFLPKRRFHDSEVGSTFWQQRVPLHSQQEAEVQGEASNLV